MNCGGKAVDQIQHRASRLQRTEPHRQVDPPMGDSSSTSSSEPFSGGCIEQVAGISNSGGQTLKSSRVGEAQARHDC